MFVASDSLPSSLEHSLSLRSSSSSSLSESLSFFGFGLSFILLEALTGTCVVLSSSKDTLLPFLIVSLLFFKIPFVLFVASVISISGQLCSEIRKTAIQIVQRGFTSVVISHTHTQKKTSRNLTPVLTRI